MPQKSPSLVALVTTLGIAQIISWGTLFYAIGVLGPAMRRDLQVGELYLFGSFTAGLLVSGTLAPHAGRLVDRRGGHFVLTGGTLLAIVAMALLAFAPNAPVMVAGWLVAGAAMAACLYDPAFATLARLAGPHYRRSVTALTLFGGFASTVFWPASHLLMEAFGWRATFGIYAALHLLACLPIHLLLPKPGTDSFSRLAEPAVLPGGKKSPSPVSPAFGDARLRWLTASFAIATFIFAVIAVHIVSLLTSAGLSAGEAVTISMLVGPMQVAGRVIEFSLGKRVPALAVGFASFACMLVAVVFLILVEGFGALSILFVIAYGFGNGLLTIARGTTPVELFGPRGLGELLGHLSRAALYAKAVAPAAFTGMLTAGLTRDAALGVLAGLAVAGSWTYFMASRTPRTAPA